MPRAYGRVFILQDANSEFRGFLHSMRVKTAVVWPHSCRDSSNRSIAITSKFDCWRLKNWSPLRTGLPEVQHSCITHSTLGLLCRPCSIVCTRVVSSEESGGQKKKG